MSKEVGHQETGLVPLHAVATAMSEAPPAVTCPEGTAVQVNEPPIPVSAFRPFWMIGPEPAWCVFGHFDDDTLADRRHESVAVRLRMSLEEAHDRGENLPAERRYDPAQLHVKLVQRLAEAEPALRFFRDRWAAETWFTCTPGEAADLAGQLDAAARRGVEPLPGSASPEGSPFWLATVCPPWCDEQHSHNDFYEDRVHAPDGHEDLRVKIDLSLERATSDDPEWLDLTVLRHYRDSIGTIHISKTERVGVALTPVEARTLARDLRRLIHTIEAPPVSKAPNTAVTSPQRPTPLRYRNTTACFPCPRRLAWCTGHSKQEILHARTPGNILLHSMPLAEVPDDSEPDSFVQIAIEHDDDPSRPPYAYLSTISEGAEFTAPGIDRLIEALRQARAVLASENVVPTLANLTAVTMTDTNSTTPGDTSHLHAPPLPKAA